MKKLIVLAALTLSTASFAVDEHFKVEGKDLSGSSAGGSIGGNPVGGSSGGGGGSTGGGGSGGSGSGFRPSAELTNAQVLVLVIDQFKEMVNSLSQTQAWVEMDVTVTTKAGTKVDVHFRAGYGKTEIMSKSKPH